MSDDLVKRLRETTHMYQVDCELKMKCADRIEELEAKLEKAEVLAYEVERRMFVLGGYDNRFTLRKALEAYRAELTGGKDE